VAAPDDDLNLVPQPVDRDLFTDDVVLVEAVRRHGGEDQLERLREVGRQAGSARALRWAELVDVDRPRLRTHDPFGRRVDEVDYHPAWHRLLQAGVRAGLTAGPWADDAEPAAHLARAAALLVWSQLETGHTGALTTSYAAVPGLDAEPDLAKVWLPRLASRAYEPTLRPAGEKVGCLAAVAVTERQAGTDLRATATVATAQAAGPVTGGRPYLLSGQKWFCSSPTSDVSVVLAQAPGGLTCFLVPRVLDDGTSNTWRLLRLETTVGRRSAAAADVELDHTWGVRIGDEGRGLRVLTDIAASTRLDGVLTSAGLIRAGVVRAVHHARHRRAFGAPLVDKPLMQNVLADLALESEASTLLAVRLAAAVDAGESDLLRVAVPVAKYWVTKRAVAVLAEASECLGGNGYVEEHGIARLFRDAPAATMWEGTANINALDVLRAMSVQPRSMEVLLGEVDRGRGADQRLDRAMDEVAGFLQAASREARRDPAAVEGGARWMVERLAVVLQAALLVRHAPGPVASAFLATRVAGGGGALFGTLPVGRRSTQVIVDRALPS
jgi:putative acyl-CoA dehydrogenase